MVKLRVVHCLSPPNDVEDVGIVVVERKLVQDGSVVAEQLRQVAWRVVVESQAENLAPGLDVERGRISAYVASGVTGGDHARGAGSANPHAANRDVTQHNNTVLSAIGIRAAQSWTPNIPKDAAIIQYFKGDFSRYATPSSRAVTQSPDCSMLRAICPCTASTSSIREGGLTMQPMKIAAATSATITW